MKQKATTWTQRVILALVFLLLLFDVMGGALRWVLYQAGLESLVYLPKVLIGAALVFTLPIAMSRVNAIYLGVLALVGLGFVIGLTFVGDPMQVFFGMWVLIPFLTGIIALSALKAAWPTLGRYILILWMLAVCGVLINAVYPWPWTGLKYLLAEAKVEGSRFWHTMSLNRLAGFSRASFAAANQILMLSVLLMVWGHKVWRVPVWLISGGAIALTTSKAALGTYILLTIFWIIRPRLSQIIWRPLPGLLAAAVIGFPLSTLVFDYKISLALDSYYQRLLLVSFGYRLEWTWPRGIEMVVENGSAILGRGFGGIGMAQRYFEPALYSSGDNLALYLLGLFGVVGPLLLVLYAVVHAMLPVRDRLSLMSWIFCVIVLLSGVTANVMESTIMALAFGASLHHGLIRAIAPKTEPGRAH